MSEGYNGLKAFAFTAGVTILIFIILYVAKRYNPGLFGPESFSRNYSWYSRSLEVPLDIRLDGGRQPVGEEPKMWDVWIASWYPLFSRRGPRSERLVLGKGENEKLGASHADVDENGPRYGEFLPLSADKVSDAATTDSSPRLKDGRPTQCAPSTQIRINTIILMPSLPPRPMSPPSTSSPRPSSSNTGGYVNQLDPPREYVLGTSYAPYTPDD